MQTRPQICSVLIKAVINHQDRWERAFALAWCVWKCAGDFVHERLLPLSEHSHLAGTFCPFTGPGAFSWLPVTKRSILQHQRCQPPLCERTIRRRVRWPAGRCWKWPFWPLSVYLVLSLSLFMIAGAEKARGQNTCQQLPIPPPTCRCAAFTAFPDCGPYGKQTLFAYSKSPSRQNSSFLPLLYLNDVADWCVCTVTHSFHICGAQISCLLMENLGCKMDANRWLHK